MSPEDTRSSQHNDRRDGPRVIDPVPVIFDKPRTLRMDFKAMKAFRLATGLNPWDRAVWEDPDPEVLAKLVWASLLHEDPDLTIAEVEAFPGMDMGNIGYVSEKVGDLWGVTMPDPDPPVAVQSVQTDPDGESVGTPPPNPTEPTPMPSTSTADGSSSGPLPNSTLGSTTITSGGSHLGSSELS